MTTSHPSSLSDAALRLSEPAAYSRITAARAARRYPEIFTRLADGDVTLTTVTVLAAPLTDENHEALLEATCGKSKRDVERLVASLVPQPDIASSEANPGPRAEIGASHRRNVVEACSEAGACHRRTVVGVSPEVGAFHRRARACHCGQRSRGGAKRGRATGTAVDECCAGAHSRASGRAAADRGIAPGRAIAPGCGIAPGRTTAHGRVTARRRGPARLGSLLSQDHPERRRAGQP